MSHHALRAFIRESLLNEIGGSTGQDLRYNPDIPKKTKSTGVDKTDPSFPDRVVTFFSTGFTPAQKRGEGNDSIIGSKVSITKMGPPMFVVLCKVNYQGKEYLIARKYSEGPANSFNPVPEYGQYLDPNVLIHGEIVQLPDPEKVYKVKEEDPVMVSSTSGPGIADIGHDESSLAGALLRGGKPRESGLPIVGPPRLAQGTSLIRYALDPDVQSAEKRAYLKQQAIKAHDTAARARSWVETKIGAINRKPMTDINQTLLNIWKIVPVTYADFDGEYQGVSRPSFISTLKPEELFNNENLRLFEFDPDSKVFPPPYSYTVAGVVNRMEQDCSFDTKEYINSFWKYINNELSERDELNLTMCSNQIATDIVLDFITLALSFVDMPWAAAAVRASITAQSVALFQLLIYQVSKNDKDSAIVTAARIVLQVLSHVDLGTACSIIQFMIQLVADVTGSVSVDVAYVKKFFNDRGMRDDQPISEMPEYVSLEDVESQMKKLPSAL